MSGTILTGTCIDGPWARFRYTHITRKPINDRFNVVGAGEARVGSYTWGMDHDHVKDTATPVWRWGPWIEEPEKTS